KSSRSSGFRCGVCVCIWRHAVCPGSAGSHLGGFFRPGPNRLFPGIDVAVDLPGRTGTSSLASQFSQPYEEEKSPREASLGGGLYFHREFFRNSEGPPLFPSKTARKNREAKPRLPS